MGHTLVTAIGYFAAVIAFVAFTSGAPAAMQFAERAGTTIGTTAAALLEGIQGATASYGENAPKSSPPAE